MPVVKNGTQALHFVVEGEGPPVLLIQGAGAIGEGWRPQVDALKSRYRTCVFDNRGIGESGPVSGAFDVGALTSDALAVLDAIGWANAHVVGHSLGGVIAQQLALEAPERVRSLSLLCTVARGRDVTRLTRRMVSLALRMRLGTLRMRRRAFLEMVLPESALRDADPDALASSMALLFGRDLAEQPRVVMRQVSALGNHDTTARLPELARFPTLVVTAREDCVTRPQYGRALAAGIAGSRHEEIADAGHGVTIQCPDRINALLVAHFEAAELLHQGAVRA